MSIIMSLICKGVADGSKLANTNCFT